MKFLIAMVIGFSSISSFGDEAIPLKSVANFRRTCQDDSFSYDKIVLVKEDKTLSIELNSGFRQAIRLSPDFEPQNMGGNIRISMPVEGCLVSAMDSAIIKCLMQTSYIEMELSNRFSNDVHKYHEHFGQARIAFNSSILETTAIGHGQSSEVSTVLGAMAKLDISTPEKIRNRLELIIPHCYIWHEQP
ncbi:MAG: hypothetical protein OXB88_05990 [Bacteriovoracales bacterium]|nr:hypothetical protein [Bacteriovoracales bacterium]